MNVYFVYTFLESCGFFVIAESYGKAKSMCVGYLDDDYIYLRAEKRKVDEKKLKGLKPCIIDRVDDPLLKNLGLEYYSEDEDE